MEETVDDYIVSESRVEDYISDKLQNEPDLENIEALLQNLLEQQNKLQQQLSDAETALKIAKEESKSREKKIKEEVEAFEKDQATIDHRLLIITRSETSDDAVSRFDNGMELLRKLEVAQNYVQLLKEVDDLKNNSEKIIRTAPQQSLKPFIRLQNIATSLKTAQDEAEGAAPHLVDYVNKETQALWSKLKDAFVGDFEKILKKMKWPSKDLVITPMIEQEWREAVERLLDLQEPQFNSEGDRSKLVPKSDPFVLLPLETMVRPMALAFKYHFEGNRPTNRPEKPEYFFSHILGLLDTHANFFVDYLQPILSAKLRTSRVDIDWVYTDATSAFITALLPMVRHKLLVFLPQISNQPQLLSHCIHELMKFDTTLKDEWEYDGGYGLDGWKGLAWEVLVQNDWFDHWLQVEKNFALARYQEIIDSKDSGEIDYDTVEPGATKPTKVAIRVNDLLETITDRYRPLTSFSHKLRFLIDIQIAIFDKFHQRLNSSLEAYLTLTSTIGRTVQRTSKEDQEAVQGIAGLERLCRVFGSSEYLEKKMLDWSDDMFFIELWDELQARARQNSSVNLAGPMSVSDIAERTSSSVGADGDGGALFDETASAYRRLRLRSESIVQETLVYEVRGSLRAYSRINAWSSLSASDATVMTVTAELDSTIQFMASSLSFLSRVLSIAPLYRITKQICTALQTYVWDYVLLRNNFSSSGIAQLKRDIEALCATVDKYVGKGQAELWMQKLGQAVRLLALPMREANGGIEVTMDLLEVERSIFKSNEDAREVLAKLGIDLIGETEARQLLRKRIELAS